MIIKTAEFAGSVVDYTKCPGTDKPEYAFIGRSNVGKSSLINMLCNRKGLAKTSGSPGKTQTINHFLINDRWYLVDLPGYGFARVSKDMREKWNTMINDYIVNRKNLMTVFVLVDSRIPPQQSDLQFIMQLGELRIPLAVTFTKSDGLTKAKLKKNTEIFNNALKQSWEELPVQFITSAESKAGRDEILKYIEDANRG